MEDGGEYEEGTETEEYALEDYDAINFGELAWVDDGAAQWPTIAEGEEAWTTATRKKRRGTVSTSKALNVRVICRRMLRATVQPPTDQH